jgi:hypothetical protein
MTAVEIGQIAGALLFIVFAFISARKAEIMGRRYWLHLCIGLVMGPLWLLVLYIITPEKMVCEYCHTSMKSGFKRCYSCKRVFTESDQKLLKQ